MQKLFALEKLSDDFDKKSAKFCDKIKKLANEENLDVFIVVYNKATDNGSSYTSPIDREDLNNPITHARLAHEEWEIKNNINPDHKR